MTHPSTPARRAGRRTARRLALVPLLGAAALLAVPAIAVAHAVVFPKTSTAGGHEKYMLRVPNEKGIATLKVEIQFPADVRVTAFGDVPGWQVEVLTDSAQRIVGATWTGTLPPKRFIEFPFVAANPKTGTKLTWLAYQTYADGERVAWTGEAGTKTPASFTTVLDTAAARTAGAAGGSGGGSAPSGYVSYAALALALVSLGLALRRPAA